jgi:hypothetical protein
MAYDVQDLIGRGWRKWNNKTDKDGCVLLLCPLKEFISLPNGTLMESIHGENVVKGIDDIAIDTRSGLLAYGVRV